MKMNKRDFDIFVNALIRGYKTEYRKAVRQDKRRAAGEVLLSNTYKPKSIWAYIEDFKNNPIFGEVAQALLKRRPR